MEILNNHSKDHEINELNKTNTADGSESTEFVEVDIRFRLGFWPTQTDSGLDGVFLALIAWTPEGWVVVDKIGAIINDDLMMYMGSVEEDVNTYLWFVAEQLNKPLQEYLIANLPDGEELPPLENWRKVLAGFEPVTVENGFLHFGDGG